jgi:endonuclease/exonuclease/phosphatase family metal-dependent hydrolase
VTLTLPASPSGPARTVSVTGVHTQPPRPDRLAGWRRDLATIADRAATDQHLGPRIYTGDFNASRDHAGFRAILDTGLVDAGDAGSAAPWPGFTWPTDRFGPAATRIDHVLLTPGTIGVRKVTVVTVSGTDHHGVVADLIVRPG